MENKNGALNGILYSTFTFTLFVVFMVLKLCGVINWSWAWVTSPLWIGAALSIVLVIILLIVWAIYSTVLKGRKRRYLKNVRK